MMDFFFHPVVQFGIASAIVTGLWALAYWKGTVDTKLGDHMKEIRDKLADILQRLPPAQPTVAANSPRQFTDFGREIAGRLDAIAWASAQAPNLEARGAGPADFAAGWRCRRRGGRLAAIRPARRGEVRVAACGQAGSGRGGRVSRPRDQTWRSRRSSTSAARVRTCSTARWPTPTSRPTSRRS